MVSELKIKNFGPIKDVDIKLKNVNVFIGAQASGKSALAKIYTILKAPRKFLSSKSENLDSILAFRSVLDEYNISSFLKVDTTIDFESELHNITYSNGTFNYEPKLLNTIINLEQLSHNIEENRSQIVEILERLSGNFIYFRIRMQVMLNLEDRITSEHFSQFNIETLQKVIQIIKNIESDLSTNTAIYIPAERNFANIIKASAVNLMLHNVPIPKHILQFSAEIEKANVDEINLSFISEDLLYRKENGEERIVIGQSNSIKLEESASGIQSVLPILISIKSRDSRNNHKSFVIEEPELNLFPSAQYELIKFLEGQRAESYWEDFGTIHIYTTHSPYVLSALNNLLYANKVKNLRDRNERKVYEVLPVDINPYYFTAYQIYDGKAKSIFDLANGLIIDNFIDEASDKMSDDFDMLMNIVDDEE